MADYTIVVLRAGNECRVWPPYQLIEKGGKVTWKNLTRDNIYVNFWEGDVLVPGSGPHPESFSKPIAAGGKESAKVHATAPDGRHKYSIYCDETQSFAIGNSEPELDI